MKVLVVEDDMILRLALQDYLTHSGHEVLVAKDGQEALDIVFDNRDINLIICDIMMPSISGPTFIMMLKNVFGKYFPKIVVISAVKKGTEFLKKIEIDYDYFLSKPFPLYELELIIKDIKAGQNS